MNARPGPLSATSSIFIFLSPAMYPSILNKISVFISNNYFHLNIAKPEINEVPELNADSTQTSLYIFVLYLL